ncbi:hypothetical protein [Vibrio algarum]|uniref:ABC transporter n=1 Tax=Vibrio algarum TaxID=3020714 RepID=A0ABT4YTA5_9VIBR|nr:hypothetical protein [Vibrio sp. KJ40-1]MDB1124288.1 hypothetical protein [Vibrio sp. KJ40-1]
MHPSIYMLEKELIEHKVVTRVPLFLLVVIVLMFVGALTNSGFQQSYSFQMEFNGYSTDIISGLSSTINSKIIYAVSLVSLILSSLYLPKTLRKERLEGSSMFWRSMPVSHGMTHAVKLAFGLLVIPLICSVLVLGATLMLWVLNLATDTQVAMLLSQSSLFDVVINWFSFLARMTLVAFALLPLAIIAMMVSQLVSSPILVMVITSYAVKWLSAYLFGFDGVGEFFNAIFSIPAMIFSPEPLIGFARAGIVNLVIYYVLGIAALTASLSLSQTNEVSFRGMFSRG